MLFIIEETGNKILFLKVAWDLDENDYARFHRELDELVRSHGKMRLLITLDGFRTPTPETFWQRMEFDQKYTEDIECFAFVSDYGRIDSRAAASIYGMGGFEKIRFFPLSKIEEARRWVLAPVLSPSQMMVEARLPELATG